MNTNGLLESVFEEIYGYAPNPAKKPDVTDLAERLSKIAKREKPWGYTYVNSVIRGSLKPSMEFVRTVEILGGSLDGQSPIQARLNPNPVTVYSVNGLQNGDVVLSHSKRCALPTCGLRFVPVVPWQKYCCGEHTGEARRSRRISSTE